MSQITGLTAVACEAAGRCLAAGSYTARSGGVEGLIDMVSDGTWTPARAPLPADAATAKQDAFFDSATGPAVGDCVAVGGYTLQNGTTMGFIETAASAGPK